jgi:hydroxypyruvate reductase
MYRSDTPVCIIAGGETTVTVKGTGLGGRNQEMAAAALLEMARHPLWYERVLFLAASTDGTDGPTDAAGGMADLDAVRRLAPTHREAQAVVRDALVRSDSYSLLSRADALVKTGPTGTNVCDIQLVLHSGGEEDDTQEAT